MRFMMSRSTETTIRSEVPPIRKIKLCGTPEKIGIMSNKLGKSAIAERKIEPGRVIRLSTLPI
jgi:hypothetical protein